MFNFHCRNRAASCLLCCALAMLLASAAPAQTINISLNVFYDVPSDITSGGTWEVVAKSTHFGIGALDLRLTDIDPAPVNEAPRGNVNGSDLAGFGLFEVTPHSGFHDVLVAQLPTFPGAGQEEGIFYGVGTLVNGAPNWPGRPAGTTFTGPAFTSLMNVVDVPWAADGDAFGDAAWNAAATLVSGTFDANVTPDFFAGRSGSVLTTVGTSTTAGTFTPAALTTIVRTNFSTDPALPGDFNEDGKVDQADYINWRRNQTANNPLPNDNGLATQPERFNLWKANFGDMTMPGGGSGQAASAVPEPASCVMFALGAIIACCARKERRQQF